jgi:hypothetical protein
MAREHFKFQRGDYLRDIITGLSGVVTARMDSITGCDRYCIQPGLDKDGKPQDAQWLDDQCLEYDPQHLGKKVDLNMSRDQPPG